ncbi:MAG: hypothetical protein FWG87_06325 [Defluviitaleaceae bacterium]|nr:hypothetical protein [Defluviitaleaceae bacterium]
MTPICLFDKTIIEAILDANLDNLHIGQLKKQLADIVGTSRTLTGVGFWSYFEIGDKSLSVGDDVCFKLGGVYADLEGLEYGSDYILYIEKGLLECLEGYCYEDEWPPHEEITKIENMRLQHQ